MTAEKGLGRKKSAMTVACRMAELPYALLRDGSEREARPFMGGRLCGEELAATALRE